MSKIPQCHFKGLQKLQHSRNSSTSSKRSQISSVLLPSRHALSPWKGDLVSAGVSLTKSKQNVGSPRLLKGDKRRLGSNVMSIYSGWIHLWHLTSVKEWNYKLTTAALVRSPTVCFKWEHKKGCVPARHISPVRPTFFRQVKQRFFFLFLSGVWSPSEEVCADSPAASVFHMEDQETRYGCSQYDQRLGLSTYEKETLHSTF